MAYVQVTGANSFCAKSAIGQQNAKAMSTFFSSAVLNNLFMKERFRYNIKGSNITMFEGDNQPKYTEGYTLVLLGK